MSTAPWDKALLCALAASPDTEPTDERRVAIARLYWRSAMYTRRTPLPAWAKRLFIRGCLDRVEVLSAPGPFDHKAYDSAAGLANAWAFEWRLHAAHAREHHMRKAPTEQ